MPAPLIEFPADDAGRARRFWGGVLGVDEQRLAELPADREIVAYCRGPFCAYANDAVRRLQATGRPARRLEDGWPEWRLADKPAKRHRAA